jgi:hypothetical protein
MLGVSRTTLWRLVTGGLFPAPMWISPRARGFRLEEVEQWMSERSHVSPLPPPRQPKRPLGEELGENPATGWGRSEASRPSVTRRIARRSRKVANAIELTNPLGSSDSRNPHG